MVFSFVRTVAGRNMQAPASPRQQVSRKKTMADSISYDTATAAQKLGDAILRFGIQAKLLREDASSLTGPELLLVLDDALTIISSANELVDAAKALGNGITVDIFWERQGFYFVHIDDLTKVSEEYPTLNAIVRYLVPRGYALREVRRTRGPVAQPKPPLPPRKSNDAE